MRKKEKSEIVLLTNLIHEFLNSGRWQEALVIGNQLAERIPQEPTVQVARGIAWLRLNDLRRSEICFRKALKLGCTNTDLFLCMAEISARRGDHVGELHWGKSALERDPENTEALFVIAAANRHLGLLTDAEAALQEIISCTPGDTRAHRMLGFMYLHSRRFEEAESEITEALKIRPDSGGLWADLGHMFTLQDKLDDALTVFQRALELEPDVPARYYNVGDTLLALGLAGKAVPYLRKAIDLDPDYSLAQYDLGLALLDLENYEESIMASQSVIEDDPDLTTAQSYLGLSASHNIGFAFEQMGRYDEAEKVYRQGLRPAAPTFFNLGLLLSRQKRFEESLNYLQQAHKLAPENAEYLVCVGNAFADLNRFDEAVEAIQEAIQIDEMYDRAYYDLGLVYARMQGKQDEALEAYFSAINHNENFPLAYYDIGCIYALQKKDDLALEFLEKALEKGYSDLDHIKTDPDWNSMRSDTRFQKIIRKYSTGKE